MDIMKLFKEKKVLIAGPCSFGTYEELDTTWKIDKEQMIEKIKQLTVMQVYAIFSLCNKFLIIANKGDAEESKIIYELFKPVEPTE